MKARGEALAAKVEEQGLERILVTNLVNVRYLSGFTGTNGACICGGEERLFLTDFRYGERAAAEVEDWETVTLDGEWLSALAERLHGKVGFEDQHLSVRSLRKLEDKLGDGVELEPAGDLVEKLRRSKDEAEIERIAAAAELADEVYRSSLERGLGGRSEREVARAAEARIRELGAEPSFPPIVAAGANGALPHAEPGDREITAGDLVVFDMGAQLDGYCSDCTRTYAVGEPDEAAAEVYELVREAQAIGLVAVAAGRDGKAVDAEPRQAIDAAGHAEHFGHGLGHGVGLEVHEAPRLSKQSEDTLAPGDVVTVEPGIYLPGVLGVRIEDLVVVTEDGHRNLSGLPKELQVVD